MKDVYKRQVYEKPDDLDVDISLLPIANVKVEIGKPIIKKISFGGLEDSYDFENNKTDIQICLLYTSLLKSETSKTISAD